eukprot:scaffold107482_cov48-Prasinocladus_malaysianus.AAC.1
MKIEMSKQVQTNVIGNTVLEGDACMHACSKQKARNIHAYLIRHLVCQFVLDVDLFQLPRAGLLAVDGDHDGAQLPDADSGSEELRHHSGRKRPIRCLWGSKQHNTTCSKPATTPTALTQHEQD